MPDEDPVHPAADRTERRVPHGEAARAQAAAARQHWDAQRLPETATAGRVSGRLPEHIGRYHIKRVIASGGMGTVYEATQESPRRVVAVKVMKQGIASRSALRRFEYEGQILGRLRHPGIAQIFEAGLHVDSEGVLGSAGSSAPYFAMEYIPNAKPIIAHAQEKKLSIRERMKLFVQVCDAIHHGHQKGIIHRDLKPSNILVDSTGQVKIIDFGVARSTDSDLAVTTLQTDVGQLIGTLQYMSPEQCEADPHDIDIRSDVYALGVVFYELLCDKLPYDVRGLPIHQATRVIREQTPTSTRALDKTLRGDIETIAFKALEKERSRRYQSAAEFGQDIQRYLDQQPIQARRPSVLYQVRIFARRNKAAFSAIAATFFILVAGVIVSTSMYFRAERARAEQSRERQRAEGARNEAQAVTTFLSDMLAQADPWKSGKDILVRQVLDEASKTIATKFADEPLAEAQLRGALGNAYFGLGLHPQAEPHLRATLEIRERELGKSHVDAIRSMNDLTRLYYSQGRIDECEALNSAAIDAARETLGEEDVLTLTALQLRANVLREKRRSQEALTLGRRVWEVRRRVLGEEHIETLKTAYNIALYYIGLGQKAEGIALLEHTLASLRRTVGEAHPMTLGTADVLADMYWGEGRIEEAVAILERTWRSQIDILGSDHPDTVRTMWRLPGAYLDLGRRAEAAQLQQRLLPHLRWQAEREGATASDLNRCAWLLLTALDQALHDPPRARSFAERACLLERQRGGNGVWDYARTLALARFRMGEPNAAMETAVQVLFPLEGDDAGEQLNDYASVLLTDDNLKGVDPTGRTALAVAERACALDQDGGESRGLHLDTLALAQHRTGNTAKAIETQKKALSMLAPEDYHRRDMEKRLAEFEAVLSARVPDASSP